MTLNAAGFANAPPLERSYAMNTSITRRRCLQASLASLSAVPLSSWGAPAEDHTGGDPLNSMQWPLIRDAYMGEGVQYAFNPAIVVKGPPFAEDAMAVPIMLDTRALVAQGHEIERIEVAADRNPIPHVLTFYPERALPVLAFRFRMEQASPVRAMVKTRAGLWFVGHTWVDAAGGGCTVPGASRKNGSWSRTLNQVQAKIFPNALDGSGTRLRVRVMHPMDTGLVSGIPSFHLEELVLRDDQEQALARLEMHEPISENPLITFELGHAVQGQINLSGRDNNGNTFFQKVTA